MSARRYELASWTMQSIGFALLAMALLLLPRQAYGQTLDFLQCPAACSTNACTNIDPTVDKCGNGIDNTHCNGSPPRCDGCRCQQYTTGDIPPKQACGCTGARVQNQ